MMRLALAMPYERRVAFMGIVMARVLGPAAGLPSRITKNLKETLPDLGDDEIRAVARMSANNMGRTIAEIYSGKEFTNRCAGMDISGEGLAHLEKAHALGKPAVLITGHIGNYDAPRAALIARGFRIAGLYRPMNNALFNKHYLQAMKNIGPAFPRGKSGMTGIIRHLKKGGMAEFLIDQHFDSGVELEFFGRPAITSVVPAEISLRYDAPLIAMYGLRKPNGVDFELIVEAPIEPSDPATMTQALNDSLEARARGNLPQWMWAHRRWKQRSGGERRRTAGAKAGGEKPRQS